jgi:hypothetical protein
VLANADVRTRTGGDQVGTWIDTCFDLVDIGVRPVASTGADRCLLSRIRREKC